MWIQLQEGKVDNKCPLSTKSFYPSQALGHKYQEPYPIVNKQGKCVQRYP
ncbi:hypothetical protein Fmac_015350 [Flemingia macrophylla]|uniref:Uncharacterized protein n=1 Tax=Flemingia macrophylla TaxID=520843 RepID=A0ABD1MEB4_9FABA